MKKVFITIIVLISVLTACSYHSTDGGVLNKNPILPEVNADTTESDEINNVITQDTTAEIIVQRPTDETTAGQTEPLPVGGPQGCPLHNYDYDSFFHNFNYEIIRYVGEDNFKEWHEECKDTQPEIEGCSSYFNLYNFIRKFDIPKDVFAEFYYQSFFKEQHDIDLLYSDDFDSVIEYYLCTDEKQEIQSKYQSVERIKGDIEFDIWMAEGKKYPEFYEKYCKDGFIITTDWSFADFVKETRISQEDFKELIYNLSHIEYPGEILVLDCFDFDYDLLFSRAYELDAVEPDPMTENINEDLMFCRQPLIKAYSSSN